MTLVLPRSFLTLHAAGHLDYWGRPYGSMTDAERERVYRERVTRVLWLRPIEWDRTPDEVLAGRSRKLRPGLLRFAGNRYGEPFCLYPAWALGGEAPVVQAFRETASARVYARSFDECVVRAILESYAEEEPDESIEGPSRNDLFRAHRAIAREHLAADVVAALDALGDDPDPARCAAALDTLVDALPTRKLDAWMQPVRYAEEHIRDRAALVRCYETSERFYAELVAEGRPEHEAALAEVRERLAELRRA